MSWEEWSEERAEERERRAEEEEIMAEMWMGEKQGQIMLTNQRVCLHFASLANQNA
jgi:hypothetical protein